MGFFVWTKMDADGGQSLEVILARRESERLAGNGVFWWAIGSSLGAAVSEKAKAEGGTLPVLFSRMPSKPHRRDTHPSEIFLWPEWKDYSGTIHKVPDHLLLWSRGADRKQKTKHFALVCRSDDPVALGDHGAFDPTRCRTHLGNRLGTSQVTALLYDDSPSDHVPSKYSLGFRALLIQPWFVTLVNPRRMTHSERLEFSNWPKQSDGWSSFKCGFGSG